MGIDTAQIAITTTAVLAPFAPFLIEIGKVSAEKLATVIAEKGGELAWENARILWNKLKSLYDNDPEVESAIKMVASKPEDEMRQTILAEVLNAKFQDSPDLAKKFDEFLKGQRAVQEILAERNSWIENVAQKMKQSGTQKIRASDSSVTKGIKQTFE